MSICRDCLYYDYKHKFCKLANEQVTLLDACPEGFTYELMYEIERAFERKMGENYELIDILEFIGG